LQSLELISGIEVEMFDSGCCGMAGDFGYRHSKVSKVIASQSLGDSMGRMNEDNILISTGTGCRKQISDVFSLQSMHLAQFFYKSLENLETD